MANCDTIVDVGEILSLVLNQFGVSLRVGDRGRACFTNNPPHFMKENSLKLLTFD